MKHKTTPTTGLLLDVAASRFRQGQARLIAPEAGTQADPLLTHIPEDWTPESWRSSSVILPQVLH